MKKVSEHLEQLHKNAARFHRTMAEAHGAIMEKSEKGSHTQEFHKTAAQAHGAAADSHDSMAADCAKAIIASDLEKANRLQPTGVHAIAPENPHLRAIPRIGAPDPNAKAAAAVPMEFEKVFPSIHDETIFQGDAR